MTATEKPTFVYALIDPRTRMVRYVGKTVLPPARRLATHIWLARKEPHKRHSMAWLLGLVEADVKPQIIVLEEVPGGQDWVEAEQFWIGYLRMLGADLCNHTIGGEGRPGRRLSPLEVQRLRESRRRGEQHHQFGKPMRPAAREALRIAQAKLLADPERREWAKQRRIAGMTPENMAGSIAALRDVEADPVRRAAREEKRLLKIRQPEFRDAIGSWSRSNWVVNRTSIIAAQNAGKGDEFRRKQSEAKRKEWAEPNSVHRIARRKKRRLTDSQVAEIIRRSVAGEPYLDIAQEFGISRSLVSLIKNRRRYNTDGGIQ